MNIDNIPEPEDLGEDIGNEKLDFIIREVTNSHNRIEELESALSQVRSQLLDGGYSKDSVTIVSIDTVLSKEV